MRGRLIGQSLRASAADAQDACNHLSTLWFMRSRWIMRSLLQDVRYGLRVLAARPAFTAVAIVTLGLGIGANTAIFSVVHAVLLKPLPYREPSRLIVLYHDYRQTNFRASVSVPGFIDYRQRKDIFTDLAAVISWSANLTGRDEPQRLEGLRVSSSYFGILGIRPALG